MDSNIWFYTYSTSAQVIAALVGLFAVFVVYKIQNSSSALSEAKLALSRLLPYVSPNSGGERFTQERMAEMDEKEMLQIFGELLVLRGSENEVFFQYIEQVGENRYSINDTTYNYFSKLVKKKSDILEKLIYMLLLSFFSISISICSLVFYYPLHQIEHYVLFTVILFLATLFFIGKYIYDITVE